jgi:cytochrome o ubiquinol oxidase subunit II
MIEKTSDRLCSSLSAVRRAACWLLFPLPIALLSGCSGGILDPQGPVGAQERQILTNALGIMLVVVVPTIAAALVFAWWFRASNTRASYQPNFVYSGAIELVVWAIPLLVITFLGGVIWIGSHQLDPFRPLDTEGKATQVQVVSLDWKWLFIYPDQGIASVNKLVVPAGVPVHFRLTSSSVMNAFFVPQLGSMVATMNGMVTQLWLQADKPGEFFGLSTQFSGDGFSDMRFTLRAVSPNDFDQWVAASKQSGPSLDRNAYMKLAQQSRNVAPFTYRGVESGIFDAIAMLHLPPGPGPKIGRGGAGVKPVAD